MFNKVLIVMCAALLGACASKSNKIEANYISPLVYASYDCEMLTGEYARLLQRSNMVNKQQDDVASNDGVATGIGMILFWPALFFIDNDDMKEQVAQLKGELIAVEQSAVQKKCMSLSNQLQSDRNAAEEAMQNRK
jgi:hypothetical protein